MNEPLTKLNLTVRQVDDIIWLNWFLSEIPEEWRAGFEWWILEVARGAIKLPADFSILPTEVEETWQPPPLIPRTDLQEQLARAYNENLQLKNNNHD